MIIEHILGFITFVLFSVALLPQIVHMRKLKDSRGVSAFWPMLGMFACMSGLTYVTLSTDGNPPIWIFIDYCVGLCLNGTVLFLKAKYSDKVFVKAITKSIPEIDEESAKDLLDAIREPHDVSKRYSSVNEMFADIDKAQYYYIFRYDEDTDTFTIDIENNRLGIKRRSPAIPKSPSVNRDVENAVQFTLDVVNDNTPVLQNDSDCLGGWEDENEENIT